MDALVFPGDEAGPAIQPHRRVVLLDALPRYSGSGAMSMMRCRVGKRASVIPERACSARTRNDGGKLWRSRGAMRPRFASPPAKCARGWSGGRRQGCCVRHPLEAGVTPASRGAAAPRAPFGKALRLPALHLHLSPSADPGRPGPASLCPVRDHLRKRPLTGTATGVGIYSCRNSVNIKSAHWAKILCFLSSVPPDAAQLLHLSPALFAGRGRSRRAR